MLFEHCFAGLPPVNAADLVASWRPGYGEWLAAQVAEGFDHTTTARFLEEKGIALEEIKAGQRDPGWELRNDGATAGDALRRAFALKGWTTPDPEHAHAMTEADWKASPWYRKEIPFRPDMTATRARVMAANFDNRRYRDALIARGGEAYGGAGSMALGLGAALLGCLPDPVNLLSLGGGMAAASRAATLGGALRAGARAGAVEGAAFTALADAVVLPDLATRGEDADFADLALDTLAGGVLGSVFGAAGGLLARRSARRAAATADAATDATDAAGATADAAPFDASPDNGFLARSGEAPARNAALEAALREAAEKTAARNAENDMLRAGMSARDRDDAARALALSVMDFNNAAPVDVSPVLGESILLEQVRREALSTVVVRSDELGVREGASLKEYQQAAREIYRVLQNKSVVHEELGEIRFTGAGFGEMKKTGFDLRKWQLVPQLHNIVKSARYIRKSELTKKRKDRIKAFHWLEASVELDGKHLRVGVNIAEDIDGNKFYNLNEDVDAWEVKYKKASDDRSGLIPPGGSEALQKEAVASPVDSSVAKDAGGVNMRVETLDLPEPDLSPAREPAAVKGWDTPEAAREAEARGLAQQDEALRQQMDELEARGALDPDEAAHARAESADTAAIGNEALHCAWTAEG